MTTEDQPSVLRQMTRPVAVATADVPLTASRAVRLAVTRAAEQSIGLALTVRSVAEDTLPLDDLIAALSDDLLMVGLSRAGTVCGLIVCDFQFAAGAGEAQTLGQVNTTAPEARKITGTDLSLTEPVLSRLIAELATTTERTVLDGWVAGITLADRISQVRRVAFDLADVEYRLMRISVDLGVDGRDAEVMVALPTQTGIVATPGGGGTDWGAHFRAAVMEAPANLNAVLHRVRVPLSIASQLEAGQVLPLPGCSVGSVRLEALDGQVVAHARLGQIAGQIAVRLQLGDDTPLIEMERVAGHHGDDAADDPMAAPLGLPMDEDDPMAETDFAAADPLDGLDGDSDDSGFPTVDLDGDLPDLPDLDAADAEGDEDLDVDAFADTGGAMMMDPDLVMAEDD